MLDAAAKYCQEAMERAQLENAVRRLEAGSRRAEEEERRRIARELHDEAGQSLLWLRLQLEMLEREAPEPLARRMKEARGIAEKTIVELRRIVAALSPSTLERLGLAAALRRLAERFRNRYPCALRLSVSDGCARVPRAHAEALYRIAQECLQNVAKHSKATRVTLSLRAADNLLRLSVSDNGAGFSRHEAAKEPITFGLTGMRDRAALVGGKLVIRSAPGKGARILLELPRGPATREGHVENSRTTH